MYTIVVFFRRMIAYDGKIISMEHWQVKLPDGREAFREVVRRPGTAAVVTVDMDGCVTLVPQHRVAIEG